jgi:endonuclease III-like uncharacterized protein
VTKELFKLASTPAAMAALSHEQVLGMIRSVGLAPTKARNLIAMSQQLCDRFGGEVPQTHEELESLPGVGESLTLHSMYCCALQLCLLQCWCLLSPVAAAAAAAVRSPPRRTPSQL